MNGVADEMGADWRVRIGWKLAQTLLNRLPSSPTNLWGQFSRKPAACFV